MADTRFHDPIKKLGKVEAGHAAMQRDEYNKYSSKWKHPFFDKEKPPKFFENAKQRRANDPDWGQFKGDKVPADPNPMTRFGAKYNELPEMKQFLSKDGFGEKAKFLAKRAAYQALKTAPVGAVAGGVSGSISSSLNQYVHDQAGIRSRDVLDQLTSLKKRMESSSLTSGKSYTSSFNPSGVSYNPAAMLEDDADDVRRRKNKRVSFNVGSNRYASGGQ
jgi:hypothetical protein